MSADYTIDSEKRLLRTRAIGTLTVGDLVAGRKQLLADPAFNPSYHELFDLRQVEQIAVTMADLEQLAAGSVLAPGICRAFVVSNDEHFLIARRFAQLAESHGQRVVTFRDPLVAEAWLITRYVHGTSRG